MKIRAHIFVSGRVQGVFFRSETIYEARKRGVTGWVRNLPDGRVEAVFEGQEHLVNELIQFCRRGPPGSQVTHVDVARQAYAGEFKDFQIVYG